MDSSSWIHGYAPNSNDGFMGDYTASCIPAVFQCRKQEQELLVSSQIQQHLNQISMQLNIDDEPSAAYSSQHGSSVVDDFGFLPNSYHATGGCSFPSSSSTSSSFRSAWLPCSPENSSTAAHFVAATATGPQFPEVSSLLAPGVVLPYVDQYAANVQDTPVIMETGASAFRRYDRCLGPRRRLNKPACGQKMFKTAMSVLAKMHRAMRYNHQQCYYDYQQQLASKAEASENQLQHMISERKRREKLNDSFHALRTVLPPGSKKDRTSILIIAREYVNSLKSKVCELEEKNQALQSQLAGGATSAQEDDAGEKVEIQISKAAAAEDDKTGEVCMVKIATRSARGGNTTDVVLRTLQCLKDQMGEDVSLVSMSTSDDSNGPHRASLELHLKSASARIGRRRPSGKASERQ
ncbi:hypothetical protein QYE76_046318 [Lolium multiflorum]|uniref:BHLH domain-containing protein n=1 Tax=Lolium multiflorum TaxID=4521 RepID=A0AAD8WYI8_LOLMU|nr:hypothetical protein QYE76_046318 [Lolium multiflorum]